MAASLPVSHILTGSDTPVRLTGAAVTPGYFDVFRIAPALGRTFSPDEEGRSLSRVGVLSYDAWRRYFAGEPNIPGKRIQLNGESVLVAGVMPADVEFPDKVDILTPLDLNPRDPATRANRNLAVVGRLRTGVTVAQAEAELRGIAASLAERSPDTNAGWSVRVVPIREQMVGDVRPSLLLLLAAVGLVLLIACTNVANLLLVRAAGRQREIAIRLAMGAERSWVVRQLLMESLLLSAVASVLGLLFGVSSVRAFVFFQPDLLPRMQGPLLNGPLVAFTAGLAIFTALFFGLVPALQLASTELTGALRDGGRGSTWGRPKNVFRSALVAGEVALSLVLLIGTGLVVRSLMHLYSVEPGFQPKDVLTMYVALPPTRYEEDARIVGFYSEAFRRIREIPGVEAAGGVTALPMTGANFIARFQIDGAPLVSRAQRPPARYDTVTPGYFEALKIPLKSGRAFTDRDGKDGHPVAIISETLAREYFRDQNPVGRKISFPVGPDRQCEIVGVVGDVKHQSLDEGPRAAIYEPSAQTPLQFLWFAVRARNVESLGPAIRRAIAAVDKDQPVDHVRTMEQVISASVLQRRMAGFLVSGFACLALILAAVGIYGVISYSVEQRRTEIGIRLAIGARHEDVLGMILRQGLSMALIGGGVGLLVSIGATRLLGGLLYGVRPLDPLTYVMACLLILVIAAVASLLPARRVVSIHPSNALRND
jgi:putative ABC transport system permease protein